MHPAEPSLGASALQPLSGTSSLLSIVESMNHLPRAFQLGREQEAP